MNTLIIKKLVFLFLFTSTGATEYELIERKSIQYPNLDAIGAQKTVFALVNFQDQPGNRPWSVDEAKKVFQESSDFLYRGSYQKTYLTGDIQDWLTLPIPSTSACEEVTNQTFQMSDQAFHAYQRIVFIFPKVLSCSFLGLGSIGGNPSVSWINGNLDRSVVVHELGHNLGLFHANLYRCPGPNPVVENCPNDEYGDPSDAMGRNGGHYNAYHKEALGWLNRADGKSPEILVVNETQIITIYPYETQVNDIKAVKILKASLPDGSQDYYYLEFRQPIDFDASLPNLKGSNLVKGILIHVGNSAYRNSSLLIDMNPSTPGAENAALLPGQVFSDSTAPQGGVAITVNSISSEGAVVKIEFGANFTGVKGGSAILGTPAWILILPWAICLGNF